MNYINCAFNLHIDNKPDPISNEFRHLLNCLDLSHNRGQTLDLVVAHGLSTIVSSVVDLAMTEH